MSKIKVFYDADALFSAFYSKDGAAHALLEFKCFEFYTSRECVREAKIALKKKLHLELEDIFIDQFYLTDTVFSKNDQNWSSLVYDLCDEHVIRACFEVKSKFLITYNIKHYNHEAIESKLDIIVCPPARLIFYARNILIS